MLYKQLTAKRWAKEQGEKLWKAKFGLIALTGLMYKGGMLTKKEAAEKLNEAGITREDLGRFNRETKFSREGK
jgi:hypothetical protein